MHCNRIPHSTCKSSGSVLFVYKPPAIEIVAKRLLTVVAAVIVVGTTAFKAAISLQIAVKIIKVGEFSGFAY